MLNKNKNKIYFISGVSGVGKTSTLKELKKILPRDTYDTRDFDERGVPDGGGPVWHDNETRYWLDVAAVNASNGKNTIISGFINPEQFKNIHNPDKDIHAQIILLDAPRNILEKRLRGRHATPESKREIERAARISLNEFVEQCASFAPNLRLIFERNKYPIIDTADKTAETIAREVVKIINYYV